MVVRLSALPLISPPRSRTYLVRRADKPALAVAKLPVSLVIHVAKKILEIPARTVRPTSCAGCGTRERPSRRLRRGYAGDVERWATVLLWALPEDAS